MLTLAALLTACEPATDSAHIEISPKEAAVLLCGNEGHLSTELYGAIAAQLNWDKDQLECAGMPRPNGRGARLRFAGKAVDGDVRLVFIIAIPDMTRESAGFEFDSNVTLIEEDSSRFFSTPDLGSCLTSITSMTALDELDKRYSVAGILNCMSPLPEVNGTSSVSIPELRFSGLLDWGAS